MPRRFRWRAAFVAIVSITAHAAIADPIRIGEMRDGGLAAPPAAGETQVLAFFPAAANPNGWQGFVRVANHSSSDGSVSIRAFDDGGQGSGTLTLSIDAGETVHFNSDDLEDGNASKGLTGSTGLPAQGDWRLELTSALSIEAMAYVRTADGLLTVMHDVAPMVEGAGHTYRVVTFNPGSNRQQQSLLRLVNPGDAETAVSIRGVDDRGRSAGPVRLGIAARASRTVTALELEEGASGLDGVLGDGGGKWRLEVESDTPLLAISLLASPTGHLTNLSTVPQVATGSDGAGAAYRIPFFPAAANARGWQGFVRLANHSDEDGTVSIRAFDDAGREFDALTLAIEAGETVHFNSADLEDGNLDKGLPGGTGGPGEGDWRLAIGSDLPIEATAYVRTSDGLLTAMHDVAPTAEGGETAYRVVTFNPGSNDRQQSLLRLVNPGDAEASVSIRGVDDLGQSAGPVRLNIAAGASRTVSALELEEAGADGTLGDGGGKWRLDVESDVPLLVMSLLASPTGHLTNLSTVPGSTTATPARPEDRTYEVGETLPIGGSIPEWMSGGGHRFGTSRPTEIELDDKDFFELDDVRYTCQNAGGCVIRDGEVTQGTILQTALGGGRDDHGDSRASATSVAVGSDTPGVLDAADIDWFRVEVDGPGSLEVYTSGSVDTEGRLEQAGGAPVKVNDDASDRDANFRISAQVAAGVHYVGVRGWAPDETGGYTLHVRFTASDPGNTAPSGVEEFSLSTEDGNSRPLGIAHTNGRFFVVDARDSKVYAYGSSGTRDRRADFHLHEDNGGPTGIVFVNGRFFVVDGSAQKVYAYTASGDHDPSAGFDLHEDNITARGIAYTDGRFFVVNRANITTYGDNRKVYAYTASGDHDPAADFDLDNGSGSVRPTSITYADGQLFLVDLGRNQAPRAYAYTVSGEPEPAADFFLAHNEATGITYADGRFFVVSNGSDVNDKIVHAYTASGEHDTAAGFGLYATVPNTRPRGIAYANQRFYVLNVAGASFARSNQRAIAYTISGERDPSGDFDLGISEYAYPEGIVHANGWFFVILEDSLKPYALAYTSSGEREPTADFGLFGPVGWERRSWESTGVTFANDRFYVVVDGAIATNSDWVVAYTASGKRESAEDFELGSIRYATGLAFAEGRLFIVDDAGHRVFAYTVTGFRDTMAEFRLENGNDNPQGIVHANGRLYVVDGGSYSDGDQVYAVYSYPLPTVPDEPDLAMTSAAVRSNQLASGESFGLDVEIRNVGNAASAPTTLRYYLSVERDFSTSDAEVATTVFDGLADGAVRRESITLSAPDTNNCYFCGACVDEVDGERFGQDNCSDPVVIAVGRQTDLAVSSFVLHAPDSIVDRQTPMKATVEVTNSGELTSLPKQLNLTHSHGGMFVVDVPPLAPGESASFDASVGTARVGVTTYRACIDYPCDEDTQNNCESKSVSYVLASGQAANGDRAMLR